MKEALLCGNLEHFGHLLDDAWQAKRVSERISNPRIDRFYAMAREHVAVGGKITGAGGGGFLLFYAEPASQGAVHAALQAEGLQEMTFAFDTQGAQVIVNDPFIDHDEHAGMRWTFLPYVSAAGACCSSSIHVNVILLRKNAQQGFAQQPVFSQQKYRSNRSRES
jgi:hypothetical protein